MKNKLFVRFTVGLIAVIALLGVVVNTSHAYTTRLLGLNNPTLSHNMAASNVGLFNVILPSDEFGLGLSSVTDTLDIWKLPNRLADDKLFPGITAIFEYTSASDGNLGVILASPDMPVTFGLFALRPEQNNWVTGGIRDQFTGNDFYQSGGLGVLTQPTAPENILDAIVGIKLENLTLGVGVGLAMGIDADDTSSNTVTTDNDVKDQASTSVITIRFGAGMDFDPINVEAGLILPISSYSSTFVSGLNAFPSDQNDKLEANNLPVNANLRATMQSTPELQYFLLADFITMPQNFSGSDNGTTLDTTLAQVDDATISSLAIGTGVNWTPNGHLINAMVSGVFGSAKYILEGPAASTVPRLDDSTNWTSIRLIVDGEFPLNDIFKLRGGLGGAFSFRTVESETDVVTGVSSSKSTSYFTSSSASAGLDVQVAEKVLLDFVINLNGFTNATFFQTLAARAGMHIQL